jgi:hypothetical protein
LRAATLEEIDRVVKIDVVSHGEAPGGARLVPRTFELLRTPTLDSFDLRLLEKLKLFS